LLLLLLNKACCCCVLLLLFGPLVDCLLSFRCASPHKPVGAGKHIVSILLDKVIADAYANLTSLVLARSVHVGSTSS
jgi:hypothetical protein